MRRLNVSLERRLQPSAWLKGGAYLGGIALGLLLAAAVLIGSGVPPRALVDELVLQIFFDPAGLAQTITLAITLVLAGLSAAMALRVGFWNIGIEGQLWLGAIGASGAALFGGFPESTQLVLMLIAGAVAGAMWIGVPLLLRERFGVSEMVVTLLMSSIAYLLLQHLLFGTWRDPANSFPVSEQVSTAARFSQIGFGNVHSGLYVSIAVTILLALLMSRTALGFNAGAVGINALAARATGIPVRATMITMVLLSGALAGLAGGVSVAGTEYRLTQFIGVNATFSGIVIAFLARFEPLGVLVAAFVVAGIYNAGATLKVFYSMSEAIVVLIQSLVLLSLLAATFFSTYRIHLRRVKAA